MNCEIDWGAVVQATAAVVQAIGSIWAIGVAISISDKQHKQNVKLVTEERSRVAKEKADDRRALRNLVEGELGGLISSVDTLLKSINEYPTGPEPLDVPVGVIHPKLAIERCSKEANAATQVLKDLKVAFHGDVAGSLSMIKLEQVVRACSKVDEKISRASNLDQSKFVSEQKAQIGKALSHLSPSS